MHSNVLGRLYTITNGFVHNELALLSQRLPVLHVQVRGHRLPKPKWRYPKWYLKRDRASHNESLTKENENFVKEVVEDKYGPIIVTGGVATSWRSPLKIEPMPQGQWTEKTKRTGVIARKIGVYPLWFKNGKKILTTLLQVADNHVVRYYPPGEFKQARQLTRPIQYPDRCGCLLVGADSADPRTFTKEYCGLFANSGVMPKRFLARFFVSPEAALAPGTPLLATHFRVGDYVDVRGNTIDRGFQGVMVRWGFKGQPASHGQTKTHRRPGNIGAGGEKGRVWPGTKMPGHMGNRWRILRGLRIWRINTQYNVMWVSGPGVAGETGSYVYVYDTILPNKKPTEAPPFPTASLSFAEQLTGPDVFQEDLHQFAAPSITFSESK